jgi:hypothetical protein
MANSPCILSPRRRCELHSAVPDYVDYDGDCTCKQKVEVVAATDGATDAPVVTDAPTAAPTAAPTNAPTDAPTVAATAAPTTEPPFVEGFAGVSASGLGCCRFEGGHTGDPTFLQGITSLSARCSHSLTSIPSSHGQPNS